ncbi:MltR family transcriptional regulator [Gemmatimonadota bacterium]
MARSDLGRLLDDDDFHHFLDEFQAESDRAAAVLGAAYLDDLVKELLYASFVGDDRTKGQLLNTDQPLGSFGARVAAAYSVGLLTESEFTDLRVIKGIRNDFAHQRHGLSFETQSIRDRIGNLTTVPERMSAEAALEEAYESASPRELFDLGVTLLAYYLTRRTKNAVEFEKPDPPLWPKYDIGGEAR